MPNLLELESIIKDYYLPGWQNQLGVEASAFLGEIEKKKLMSHQIEAAAPKGLSGGFGYGYEGEATPQAAAVPYERFKAYTKDLYVNITISHKSTLLTGASGAIFDALAGEIKGVYETAKWNVGRSLFGDGSGKIATTAGGGTALPSGGGCVIPVDDTKYLKEGLMVDFYAEGALVGTAPAHGLVRISSIDREGNTITVDRVITAPAGFITVQNSYGREITGLKAIFDKNIPSIYGVDKASHQWIYPVELDCGNDISDSSITNALRRAKNYKGSDINMLMCGDAAYDHYIDYLRANNIRVEDKTGEFKGGFRYIQFMFRNKTVAIVNEGFVPDTEIWGVDTKTFTLHQTDWQFANTNGASTFTLMEGQSQYRALLANYGELLCSQPGGCVRMYNCA